MSLRWGDETRTLDLGVRDLIELDARGGRVDAALSDRARMRVGSELHRTIQAEVDEGVEVEVALRHTLVVRGWTCTIHGRADLVVEEAGRTVIEEIKSTLLGGDALARAERFGAWERQLAMYVTFAHAARRVDPVGRLRVVSLVDGAERVYTVDLDPGLERWMTERLDERVLAREERLAWLARRRYATTWFAHEVPRPGQEDVSAAVADVVHEGRHLILVAPTGVGKTAAVLLGVLQSAARTGLRVWWVTARTTQQAMIERTAAAMIARGTPLRTVTLRARDKACRRLGERCDPLTCPLLDATTEARAAAIDELGQLQSPDAERLGAVAKAHRLCPYALALDWLERCDLVIADYNYVFDPGVRLRGPLSDSAHVVVVEEAHQLPDRAMEWGSPTIDTSLVAAVLADMPDEASRRPFRTLAREIGEAIVDGALLSTGEGDATTLVVEANVRRWLALRDAVDDLGIAYAALGSSATFGEVDPWVQLARAVDRFAAVLERSGEETVVLWSGLPAHEAGTSREFPGARLALYCRDPSRVLGPRFAEAHATISMSATLHPGWFYRDRCGMTPDRVSELEASSPFAPENRRVLVVGGVSTEYKHRARDRDKLASIVRRTVEAVPGNVAVFFSSFEHLHEVMGGMELPTHELLVQSVAMDELERAALLERMRTPFGLPRVLVGVLGGLFAEGVDLPGEALRAVVVVGPALPPPTFQRRLLQAWLEERFGDGFTLASIQPGMTRVVQAAGRVVRGPEDRGVVVLVCQRFLRTTFADRLPEAWSPDRTREPWVHVRRFFAV